LVQPSRAARNLNLAVALLLVCFQCVWLLWRRVEPGLRSLTFWVGVVFFLYCLASVVRIANFFIVTQVDSNYLQSGLFEALVLLSYQVLFLLLTYSFVMMLNKRLLMQIVTQEEKFSKAFHFAPYAMTLTRPVDGKIIEVNESFYTITGYERAESLKKNTIDLNLWENEGDRTAAVEALSRTGSVRGMELRFRNKSGEALTGIFSAEIILIDGEKKAIQGFGNGPVNAFVHALEGAGLKDFKVTDYRSHAVRGGSDASAASYVQLQHDDGRLLWGAGVDPSIEMAGLKALVTAWNLLR